MQVPEIAYRYIYPKDVSGPTFEILTRVLAGAETGDPIINFTGIPKDKVLVLTNVAMLANPGATQACTFIGLSGFSSAGAIFDIKVETFPADADENQTLNWDGAVYIAGGVEGQVNLRFSAAFDAGVNSNTLDANFNGVIIPRGNIAIF